MMRRFWALAAESDDARFARTAIAALSRCMAMSCSAFDHYLFEDQLDEIKRDHGYKLDNELTADDLSMT